MANVAIDELADRLEALLELSTREAVVVERDGRPAGVLISVERYEELLDVLEDREDAAAFDAAIAEGGENIPWDIVKRDLGWR